MSFSTDKLANTAECDLVLSLISKEQSSLTYKKTLLNHRLQLINESSTAISAEMTILDVLIGSLEGVVASIPEGALKNEKALELANAKHRKVLLTSRLTEQGSVALLEIEIDKAQLDAQELQVADALAEVNARKAVL